MRCSTACCTSSPLAPQPLTRGGFVHVPWLPEQGAPAMQLRDMVRGVHAMLWAAVLHRQDIAAGRGRPALTAGVRPAAG
jgi:hypothetical protein